MSSCKLMYMNDELANIHTSDQLELAFSKIYKDFQPRNPIVVLVDESGNSLSLGISPDGCFADFVSATRMPPYYLTLGDSSNLDDKDVVDFWMSGQGHVTEIRKRNIVDFETLVKLAKFFLENGSRLQEGVAWEMD